MWGTRQITWAPATRDSAAGVEPGPPDERELQGETDVQRPGGDVWVAGVVCGHVDVGGHDGDEESDESPGGDGTDGWLKRRPRPPKISQRPLIWTRVSWAGR